MEAHIISKNTEFPYNEAVLRMQYFKFKSRVFSILCVRINSKIRLEDAAALQSSIAMPKVPCPPSLDYKTHISFPQLLSHHISSNQPQPPHLSVPTNLNYPSTSLPTNLNHTNRTDCTSGLRVRRTDIIKKIQENFNRTSPPHSSSSFVIDLA